MDTFPAIKADDTGISVKNLFSTRHFDWGEINEIKNGCSPFKGTKVLTLSPRGNLLKNFLKYYPNYIHGMMAGVLLEPAILLSNGLPNREEILKEIGKHVLADMLSRPKLME